MQSARFSATPSQRRLQSSSRYLADELQDISPLSSSRPSTQDSKRSSFSRLSTDSGEGSLEDFSRRNSSPVFYRDDPSRRHTAPIKKSFSPTSVDESRPNTVHAWDLLSSRCSLSRYAPLPSIGSQQQRLGQYNSERPVPVRRQCFMGPLDIDTFSNDDVNHNEGDQGSSGRKPVFSLTLDSDVDSDFEDETGTLGESDVEDSDSRPHRPIIRSATFTIEKERPDVHGPFLTIAVRRPSGERVSTRFDSKETLQSVCDFALQGVDDPQTNRWSLVTTDFPKRIFRDLTMSLKGAGIDDKSVLYLQTWDESDSD